MQRGTFRFQPKGRWLSGARQAAVQGQPISSAGTQGRLRRNPASSQCRRQAPDRRVFAQFSSNSSNEWAGFSKDYSDSARLRAELDKQKKETLRLRLNSLRLQTPSQGGLGSSLIGLAALVIKSWAHAVFAVTFLFYFATCSVPYAPVACFKILVTTTKLHAFLMVPVDTVCKNADLSGILTWLASLIA